MPIDLQLKFFGSLVEPIILYSSEVWAFENLQSIEKNTSTILNLR
jgi:hypothetical protein